MRKVHFHNTVLKQAIVEKNHLLSTWDIIYTFLYKVRVEIYTTLFKMKKEIDPFWYKEIHNSSQTTRMKGSLTTLLAVEEVFSTTDPVSPIAYKYHRWHICCLESWNKYRSVRAEWRLNTILFSAFTCKFHSHHSETAPLFSARKVIT